MSFRPQAILEFREAADQPVRQHPTVDLPYKERLLAYALIAEELGELAEALSVGISPSGEPYDAWEIDGIEPDVIAAGDALGDLLVVVEQLGPTLGMNTDALFAEVHRSNMSKVDPATGKMPKKPNGKAGKGPNFFEPDIERALLEYPIGMEVQGEGIDYEHDYVLAPSAGFAKRQIPIDYPTLHSLGVLTPMNLGRGATGLAIRDVYVMPGMTSSPGWNEQYEEVRRAQESCNLGGRVLELK